MVCAPIENLCLCHPSASRVSGVLVGGASLNLITGGHAPSLVFGENLEAVACSFLPRVIRCPLSVDVLNTQLFGPCMDHSTQLLQTGLLQVCAGTLMIFDETQMREGRLHETGLKSLRAIQQMISDQNLSYDFQFYQLNFNTDIKPIVISDGKSMLETHFKVRLVPDPSHQHTPEGSDEMVSLWRYLASQAHSASFELPGVVSATIEEDYVHSRQQDTTIGQHTLHLWLSLARTLALSHGETQLSSERWAQMRQMETERAQRLQPQLA